MRAFTVIPMLGLTFMAGTAFSQWWEIPNGPWTDLFNGENLDDWARQDGPPWNVGDGLIKEEGGSSKTYLIWPEPLKNFELTIKYRLSTSGANSGIQVRSFCRDRDKSLPDCGNHVVCGPQLDVAQKYSGKLFNECSRFLVQDGQNVDECRNTLKVGEWTTTTARINQDSIGLWLNGVHCLDYEFTDVQHLEGEIFAIQSHPPYDLIEWEYIKVRDLDKPDVVPVHGNPEFSQPSISVLPGGRVRYEIDSPGAYHVQIVDLRGRPVFGQSGEAPVAALEFKLPRSGVYVVRFQTATAAFVEKVFIP